MGAVGTLFFLTGGPMAPKSPLDVVVRSGVELDRLAGGRELCWWGYKFGEENKNYIIIE